MTYFRMRMHTIIGATPFHDPVRDGKGWVQSAMAAKRNFYRGERRRADDYKSRLYRKHGLEEVIKVIE